MINDVAVYWREQVVAARAGYSRRTLSEVLQHCPRRRNSETMERPRDRSDHTGPFRVVFSGHLDGRSSDQREGQAGSHGRLVRKTEADLRGRDCDRKALSVDELPFFNVGSE